MIVSILGPSCVPCRQLRASFMMFLCGPCGVWLVCSESRCAVRLVILIKPLYQAYNKVQACVASRKHKVGTVCGCEDMSSCMVGKHCL